MSGNSKITLPIQTLALPKRHGVFTVANITLYADLFLMRKIQKYCKHRAEETPTTPNLALIEFNIGQQISKLFQLRQNNYFPHATRPSITYAYILAIIKKYHFTFEQLCKNSKSIQNNYSKKHPSRQTNRRQMVKCPPPNSPKLSKNL